MAAGSKETTKYVNVSQNNKDTSLAFKHIQDLMSSKEDVLKNFKPRKLSKDVKILYIDIETSPILAMTWGTFNQYISPSQIIHPTSILCYAAQWDSSKKVMFDSTHASTFEDMMKGLHTLLSEADVVVHYNGKKFDIPRINREFIRLGIAPPEPYKQIDMLKIVKGVGGFDSNKLEWVSQAIGIGQKVVNSGWPLWLGCMNGDAKHWKEMEKYNKQDTRLLQYLYHTYLPWIRTHPNVAIYKADKGSEVVRPTCTNCGSTHVSKNGRYKTKTQMYQAFKCVDCGTHMRERTTSLSKEIRHNILVQAS